MWKKNKKLQLASKQHMPVQRSLMYLILWDRTGMKGVVDRLYLY